MNAIQQMIERINGRLATLDREARERPDWLTRLMLAGPRPEETRDARSDETYAGTLAPR
jgi:hypothetical protein